MVDNAPLASLHGLAVRAGSELILRDLDMNVGTGEVVAVYGANGSGKTTLLRVLATLRRADAGLVHIFGHRIDGRDLFEVRQELGLIGHVPALYPELTLAENLWFTADIAGRSRNSVAEALRTVGLTGAATRKAATVSHGMQRRCEIARELVLAPRLLLLDEPHSALDEEAAQLVEHLVGRVVDRGGSVIIASHDKASVDVLATRVLLLASGKLT